MRRNGTRASRDRNRRPPAVAHRTGAVPTAGIVVVTFNSERDIGNCLRMLTERSGNYAEIVVVDNGSADETCRVVEEMARSAPRLRLIRNRKNEGYTAAANAGGQAVTGDVVVFLNPDTIVTPGWLGRLLAHLDGPGVGAVGPLADKVNITQHYSRFADQEFADDPESLERLGEHLAARNAGVPVPTRLLVGFCLAVPRRVFEHVGWFDEDLFLGNEDLEFAWRIRMAGYHQLIATDVMVSHYVHRSFDQLGPGDGDALIQESTDALMSVLAAHYGDGNVPDGDELWGIDWFRPSPTLQIQIRRPPLARESRLRRRRQTDAARHDPGAQSRTTQN